MAEAAASLTDVTQPKLLAISFISSHKEKSLLISRFNRRVQLNHTNLWSFIKFQQDEEVHFHHMSVQFTTGLEARPKQAKTIVIQRRIANLDERYYDGVINAMEYLDGLSFTVAKQKK
ncbi:unnamed protein product [Rotaria sordida]|uniref:Uncharacterized protein n=1 Tax=Rotaria sordida TaxID=392033 RepID=A0A819KV29_9BILA|nr:unnamed protein product [Rotaria sordida]